MSKKKGSTLIETIVAVNIIMMMFLVVTMLIASNRANYYKRRKIEEASRVVYCIMQEIKYNISMNEIIDENEIEYLSLRYDEDIVINKINEDKIIKYTNEIFDVIDEKVNNLLDRKINKKSDNEEILEVKIEVYLENDIDKLEKSFLKYKWMEYYE